ncbi:pyrroline-5-carboxylate reductase [Entomortierella parvispora]|uniref:Pyrroline-5-carboxylate reductase n=1 Tax=Entomortierella parvispora TaxID=205924 RepID=A0A9P3HI88_9FUNG|nr:pyrroline-5-carboxylate reductase [Entomortierella parvispora]
MTQIQQQQQHARLAFIGGGNMAEAILGGLLACGYPLSQCVVSEPIQDRCQFLQSKYPGLQTLSGPYANHLAVNGSTSSDDTSSLITSGSVQVNPTAASADFSPAQVVILAVKPQVLRSVVEDLAETIRSRSPLVISIAAGIETSAITRFMASGLPEGCASVNLPPVIRVMPNTPALVLEGAAGMYATADATLEHRQVAESLMAAVSKQVSWVESESLIDTVTGISGSGPAYFFLMMEAMEEAGVALGMDRETAKALTIQTCLGAAKMAQLSTDDLKTLRIKVTSPQGTTDAAIKAFEAGGFRELVQKGVAAADARSRTLAKELGGAKL